MMARFLHLSTTTYDDSGIPDLATTEDQWINIDQVESVREVVSDTLFHSVRYLPAFYPHLLITMSSGREIVSPLGEFATATMAEAALKNSANVFLTN